MRRLKGYVVARLTYLHNIEIDIVEMLTKLYDSSPIVSPQDLKD